MRAALFLVLAALVLVVPNAAAAQDAVLVEHVTAVSVARAGRAVVVTAGGTVPIAGFRNAALRPRRDLVSADGGYVLDFVAVPPPLDRPVPQVETRLAATFRIDPPEADTIRFVQVRGASGSRAVAVTR